MQNSDGVGSRRIADLVGAYARRIHPAVAAQHEGSWICSPLGVWLLLAACVSAAQGDDRRALEGALGCSAAEAGGLLAAFMGVSLPALAAAIAVWARPTDATPAFDSWVRSLPPEVESGLMPTPAEANEWADRHTNGLIDRFPATIDALTRIVLASALATKVSWAAPFGLVPAADHLGADSPWRAHVQRLLWDGAAGDRAMLARTRAAGLVAVHHAVAREGLVVVSVSAEPSMAPDVVLDAAHEIAAPGVSGTVPAACSLFELPLGMGHSWEIVEREIRTHHVGERVERISGVSLPSWRAQSELDLLRSELFGCAPALAALRRLIGPRPVDRTEAAQTAVASFTRYGFEAAAVTAFAVRVCARLAPRHVGIERAATLRFDHPYAAVAIAVGAGEPASVRSRGDSTRPTLEGLPVFGAWVHDPQEPEDEPAA